MPGSRCHGWRQLRLLRWLGGASLAMAAASAQVPVWTAMSMPRQAVSVGHNLTFWVTANGATSYQWKHNGLPIAGATTASYTVTAAAKPRDDGWYQLVMSNSTGSATAPAIFVAVVPSRTQLVGWGSNSANQLVFPGNLTDAIAVVTSGYNNAALRADGTVASWGYSYAPPSGLDNVVAIAVGASHSLALKADGTVVQWGDTYNYQGSPPPGLADVVAIACGQYHSLALKADGSVVAWGNSTSGATSVPVGLTNVTDVAAGAYFSLAMKADGTVVGWGANSYGQSSVPAGLHNATAITSSATHGLILTADNAILSLGNVTGAAPSGLGPVTRLAAGGSHDLALKANGAVAAWGSNNSGQTSVPPGLNIVFAIAASDNQSIALRDASGDLAPVIAGQTTAISAYAGQNIVLTVNATSGTSLLNYQWRKAGGNLTGGTGAALALSAVTPADAGTYDVVVWNQLGSAVSTSMAVTVNTTPAVSTNFTGQQVVSPGQSITLVASSPLPGPVAYQWKRNGRPIAGATNASFTIANAGWRDSGGYQVVASNAVGPAASSPVLIAVSMPTQVTGWGSNYYGQLNVPAGLNNAVSVATGYSHTLALKADGTIAAWGSNSIGQLNVPAGLGRVIAVSAQGASSVALTADGTVATWGELNYTPSDLSDVVAIAAGGRYAMALRSNGTVAAWSTTETRATDVPAGLTGVVALAASTGHRLALKSDGTVVGWGANDYGQATAPAGLTGVTAIAAGPVHSVALKSDGTVVVWGSNSYGALNVPGGLNNAVAIAANTYGTVAVRADGSVVKWGSSSSVPTNLANVFAVAGTEEHFVVVRDATNDSAPAITVQPAAATIVAGQPVAFAVTATGQPLPTYQWRKNGTAIYNATNATYALSYAYATDGGSYDVVATNYLGSATSDAAILTITGPPAITGYPSSVSVANGQPAAFTVTATGTAPLAYQWRKNSVNIPDATNATLPFAAVSFADAGGYSVVVSNSYGSVSTGTVLLTVTGPPAITAWPVSQAVGLGGSVLLSVTAGGSAPLNYQWQKNGTVVTGATTAALRLTDFQATDAGDYVVTVTNALGSATSPVATLTAVASTPPSIITQPAGATLNVNNVASFWVTAAGPAPFFYQWRKNGVAIAGATNSLYVLGAAQVTSAGSYDVVVANAGGVVISATAVLAINSPVPFFTTQPQSITIAAGSPWTLTAVASGVPTPTYQWRKNGTVVGGATGTALVFTSAQPGDAGTYDVVATNSAGTATSNPAVLTVAGAEPAIVTQPVGGTLFVGGSITLAANVIGAPPLSYQWRRSGVVLTGATNAALAISNAQTYDTGDYTLTATNNAGTVTSGGAHVTVVPKAVSFSARVLVGADGTLGFFTIEGTQGKRVLLRAVGAGLAPFGLTGLLADPQLEVYDSTGALIAVNNDWSAAANAAEVAEATAAVGAFALSVGSRDSAVLRAFGPGTYTVRASGAGGTTGLALLELYDVEVQATTATIPFVAVRGRVAPADGVLIGGLAANGRGPKSYLLRATGPGLGIAGTLPNPAFLVVRDGTLVGSNDDWDADATDAAAVTNAAARVAAFPLAAGSHDAAQVLTGNLHAGPHTVQITGTTTPGTVLLEWHDLDAARPAAFAPAIVSPPLAQSIMAGAAVSLTALAHGTPPLAYQWRKDGAIIASATTSTLAFSAAQPADGGVYTVSVSNAVGTATSRPAVLTVTGTSGALAATQAVGASGYRAGTTITITNTLSYSGEATSLGWSVTLPAGWSYAAGAGAEGDIKPGAGSTGTLSWAWTTPPLSPVAFSYTLNIPAAETGSKVLAATGIVRNGGVAQTVNATPSPLVLDPLANVHSADTDQNLRMSLFELTRVIELYNTRNGTTRTGCYQAQDGTEDGFAADPLRAAATIATLARYHTADTNRDGKLSLLELTRVIELYNFRSGTTRTGQYHVQSGTEDGFAPGP